MLRKTRIYGGKEKEGGSSVSINFFERGPYNDKKSLEGRSILRRERKKKGGEVGFPKGQGKVSKEGKGKGKGGFEFCYYARSQTIIERKIEGEGKGRGVFEGGVIEEKERGEKKKMRNATSMMPRPQKREGKVLMVPNRGLGRKRGGERTSTKIFVSRRRRRKEGNNLGIFLIEEAD